MPKKIRLDQLLVARGFFASREQARRAILAGEVSVGTRTAAKPSEPLDEKTVIAVKPTRKYVGRGALKLEPALDYLPTACYNVARKRFTPWMSVTANWTGNSATIRE